MKTRLVLIAFLVCSSLGSGLVRSGARAQGVGDLTFTIEKAQSKPTLELASFPDPFVPINGEYLIVLLNVANNGTANIDYDYCPPEGFCFNPLWFEVVDESGAAYQVDETTRAAADQSQEDILSFGNEIAPGTTGTIVLVFDVPAGVASWTLRGTDQATAPFSLPVTLTIDVAAADEAPIQAEMNEDVPTGQITIVATRAEVRKTIDVPTHPEPFVPQGEYVVVYLTLTNTGAAAEYDICPPEEPRVCLNQLWFEIADAQQRAYPVEPIAWGAFSLKPDFLPFGSELAPNSPEPVALVFDVPTVTDEWWLNSTPESPRQFSIHLKLSPAPGSIEVLRSSDGSEGAESAGAAVELILDTSGSMLEELEGKRRIDVAKDVLGKLVTETIPAGTPLALRVFGNTPDSCDTNLASPLQPLDPGAMSGLVAGLEAIDGVKTPIGASLEQVASDLAGATGTKIVVLVTDGEETCGGDPAATLRSLAAQGLDVRVNIVGFAVTDDATKAQFREWAHLGNGQFFDASGAADLGAAIAAAIQPPFRILDQDGQEVAKGLVGGDPVEVPAATYDVEVQSAEPETIANVKVEPGERVKVPWDDR